MKRIAYICGPITAANAYEQELNVRRAEAVYVALCKAGIPAICVHPGSRFTGGLLTHEQWMDLCLPLLDLCTDLVCVDGWELSKGSKIEIAHANLCDIPVWDSVEAFLRGANEVAA